MKFLMLLMFLIPLKSYASCVEVMENRRVNDMTYKFYADDGQDKCLRLPYVQKNFSPQSLFLSSKKIGFISLNHQMTKLENKKLSSRVLQADLRTGKVLRTYLLKGTNARGHLKDINTVSLLDSETKFVVPSGKSVCLFDRKNALQDKAGLYHSKLLSCQEQNLSLKGEFAASKLSVNHNNEDYLWTVFKSDEGAKIYGFKIYNGKVLKNKTYSFDLPRSISDIGYFTVLSSKGQYSFLISPLKGNLAYQLNYNKNKNLSYSLASVDKFGVKDRLPASTNAKSKRLPTFKNYEFVNLPEVYSRSRAKIYNVTSLDD